MLKIMRKHARYFYVLFVVVILSFIFWGVGGVDDSVVVYLAEIGDEKISQEEYWRAYDRISDVYRDAYKEKFDEKMREDLKQKVLNQMVDDRVLLLAALEAGLRVSDEELQYSISHDSLFTRDGEFDSEIYERTLNLNRMTPEYFEAVKRRELLIGKMRRLIESTVELSPEELAGLRGDEKLVGQIREAMLESKKRAAVKSYLQGIKDKMEIKINEQLIS